MRHRVVWQQQVSLATTVEISPDELATWALGNVAARSLLNGQQQAPDDESVRRLVHTNRHLQSALLQLYASAQAQATITAGSATLRPSTNATHTEE